MIYILRPAWTFRGIKRFEDQVNGLIQQGYVLASTKQKTGFLGLRWILEAVLTK